MVPHRSGNTVQVDASCFLNGTTGWGLTIKDQHGTLIHAACKREGILVDPLLAETMGLRWSISVALILSLSRPTFLTDGETVVNWMLNRTVRAVIDPIVLDCKQMLSQLEGATIMHIRRNINTDAHHLGDHVWSHVDHLCSSYIFPFNKNNINQ